MGKSIFFSRERRYIVVCVVSGLGVDVGSACLQVCSGCVYVCVCVCVCVGGLGVHVGRVFAGELWVLGFNISGCVHCK